MQEIPGFKLYNPDGAFYLFIDVKDVLGKKYGNETIATDLDLSMYLLNVAHVSSVPGSAFGSEGYVRFSYAASEDNLREAAARVKNAIENLK
jgi:aspartate aminotransferase